MGGTGRPTLLLRQVPRAWGFFWVPSHRAGPSAALSSGAQGAVLYDCFYQAPLPLTISNAESWKIWNTWSKPGLNGRDFPPSKDRGCLSRGQLFFFSRWLRPVILCFIHVPYNFASVFSVFPFFPLHSLFTVKQVHGFFFLFFVLCFFFRDLRLLTEPQHSCVPQVEIRP